MSCRKIRLLLVDDHTVVRNGVRLMLGAAEDIDIAAEADSFQEALAAVSRDDFDVALVDIGLPQRNGLELLKILARDKPGLAVLILSMYAEDVYAVRALKLGASGYLTKDSPADVLIGAIRKAAAGGKYVSPPLVEKLAMMVGGTGKGLLESLSDRELEVLKLLASGMSLVRIADSLHLSPNTVTTYRTRILEKLNLSSNAELARFALESGLLL